MLNMQAASGSRFCDGLTRRDMLRAGAVSLGGLTLSELLRRESRASTETPQRAGKAKSVILLFLNGGPSQLDMWDLKPEAPDEIRGSYQPIETSVPGVRISEHLPRTARLAKHYTILRAVNHGTGSHPAAAYWMMVGSPIQRAAPQSVTLSREDRPHPGSVLAKLMRSKPGLPPFVLVPEAISPVGPERPGQHAGFLGPAYDPYRINGDPNLPDYNAGALESSKDMPRERLDRRQGLLQQVNRHARHLEQTAAAQALDPYYARAFDLLSSAKAQQAFDISAEPDSVRERYGRHMFGQSVLLARRLVEAGARLVQVNWVRHDNGKGLQGYDSHRDHLAWAKKELLPPTDAAFASLLEDLHERGLLAETLVVVMGEFGRTPRFNTAGGRDHWPHCFSVVMAGGGINGGAVYGASDRIAAYPTADPVTPQDLLATMYHSLSIEPDTLIHDQQQRPFPLVEGTAIRGLF